MEFVERLRQLIDSKQFTKVGLCAKIGITRETLDNYLKGKTSPTTRDVEEMSKKLGLTLAVGDGKIDPVTGMMRAYESTIASKEKELERIMKD
jgi:transcriptional regulator with XRE-family HTH domain